VTAHKRPRRGLRMRCFRCCGFRRFVGWPACADRWWARVPWLWGFTAGDSNR